MSLFSGAGGFDLGLKSAGFEIGIAIDNNPIALATYQQNFSNATILCKDIREVTGKEIRAHIQAKYPDWDGEIDVVFGGPPCQGFSVAGQQNIEDERNGLVREFVRLVLELNPLAAIMENVPGIENQKFGCITANLQAVLEEHYFLSKWNLNASNYGVPQARKRVFFVASKFDEIVPPQQFPQHNVRDAITDLLTFPLLPKQNTQVASPDWEKGEYARYLDEIFPNPNAINNTITGFAATIHAPEVIQQFINTPPGVREAKSRAKKLEWDGLCVTLRAGSGNRTALRPIHPSEPRVISVREAARLHSYPDWFNFSEGILHAHREIGNSVPPLLAYAVGMQIREHLESHISDTLLCEARSLRDESRSPNLLCVCLHRSSKGSWDNNRHERCGFVNPILLLDSLNIPSKERYAERKVFGLSPPVSTILEEAINEILIKGW
ncbi:DNA cytosine methyltransferase [Calothrix sp. PCC 6303]|uniref:DNA cytosine methyltransferase n=1 Tax=Calothrix sp. PCC 6303 TaxID=1170562 RepID=UPI0002A00998|nr:DNA cytosine methyltransferase [Calothrix sp. PCC 6303]AFY99347.1 DNA-cytosine methyltransferase [Calothrix sp. PCC 6303]